MVTAESCQESINNTFGLNMLWPFKEMSPEFMGHFIEYLLIILGLESSADIIFFYQDDEI